MTFCKFYLEEDKLVFDLLEIKNIQNGKEKGFVIFKIYNKTINILHKKQHFFLSFRIRKNN